ncbi:hypothetical protein [Paenibacillus tianjinensis]|uniref:Uncharacterized protein n=1 Tax=Paenibacillus tianjinensis TaxID=2810347 RepID=A0ABX7LCT7_9BACL|nr:hypothetical protein [Paenibacillus tianjinensis]QSF45756.1 hypothetical protein JRJ22_03710 [Paenibacillus tianjinensis]
MTFKQAISLRNIMIILCICMLALLGMKILQIGDKIREVQEAERLYAAGDLIAAENLYRQAADNPAIHYKEEQIAARLEELAPISAIRSGLNTLVKRVTDQLVTRDFAEFMESYATLISLKSKYFISGGPYVSYYRQLSEDSGISAQLTAGFGQFKSQFLAELAASQNGSGSDDNGDQFKWNLLQIPDAYYGGTDAKNKLLATGFKAHDTARLKVLAAGGSFGPMLDSSLSMIEAYSNHSYQAPWVQKQAEDSAQVILDKDLEGDHISAFAGHAAAYRTYAAAAALDPDSSKVLAFIDSSAAKLLKSAARLIRGGEYAEAIQLYTSLSQLQDTSAEIAAAQLAWNTAEPVRLLPGGDEAGRYIHVATASGRYGAKAAVAGTDNSGRLYYADLSDEGRVSTRTGDILPGFERLSGLAFDDQLSAMAEVPVVLAIGSQEDGRTAFSAYRIKPEGISLLFSFAGDSYELQPDDNSILVTNADTGDGVLGETGVYRLSEDGSYQFAEILQESPLIPASELELHPFEKVTLNCDIYIDSAGRSVGSSEGRYISLQGNVGSITGPAVVSGQYQNSYDYVETEIGEQYVPVFVVDSLGSLSANLNEEAATD